MQNHSHENDFDLHENETACRTHFHMKEFALVLKQGHEITREWPTALTRFSPSQEPQTPPYTSSILAPFVI